MSIKNSILLSLILCHLCSSASNADQQQNKRIYPITKENMQDLLDKQLIDLKSNYSPETAQKIAELEREITKPENRELEKSRAYFEQIIDLTSKEPVTSSALHNIFDPAIMTSIIKARANINDQDIRGMTPLHVAVDFNLPNNTTILLQAGADPNLKTYALLETPLHLAVEKLNREIINTLLIHKAEINARDYYGQTPLHYAVVQTNALPIVQLLVEKGADIDAQDQKGNTSLHKAILPQNTNVIQYLLDHGAKKDITNKGGDTSYQRALLLKKNNIPIADEIIALLKP